MPAFFRCQACDRIVSVRSRCCPWCKSWTGLGHADPSIDRKLEALRAFGCFAGLWTGLPAVAFAFGNPSAAAIAGIVAAMLLVAHLVVPWHAAGWFAAEIAWGVATLVCAIALRRAGWGLSLSLVPAGLLASMLVAHRRFVARLRGEQVPETGTAPRSEFPDRGPCTSCGRRDAEVVAPLYVVSVGVFTFRRTGRFRNLCTACGRLSAIPATVASFTLGWWGIPWGLLWTPNAILDNLERGGVALDSRTLAELRTQEAREGTAGILGPLAWAGGLFLVPLAIGFAIIPHLDVILGR